jgi:hypothetical protein
MPRVRRNPRFGPFLGTGVVIGALAALVIVVVRRDAVEDAGLTFLYLALVLMGLGMLIAGLVAVFLDRPGKS